MILVDPRIGSEHIIKPLRKMVNCRVEGAKPQLYAGDLCFDGNGPEGKLTVGIELKRLRDMLGSMRSERYAGDQMVKMSEMYQMCFVIVEGIWRPGKTGLLETVNGKGWFVLDMAAKGSKVQKVFYYSELFKHLISMSVIKNVIVFRSSNTTETVWQLVALYDWWQKAWEHHRSTDPIKLQTEVVFHKVSLLRKMAAELPGIGWTRSLAVEKAFMSVHHMINAGVDSWAEIEGIGPKTAQNVWNKLRERV